ncbi:MAG: hypothetical protein M3536_05870 [Actinomycetota bacterium]|nr:hypothetical protein [Actinomycetota bacterium]
MSGKGNEAYEKLDREIAAKYGHLFQRIDPSAPVREFAPADHAPEQELADDYEQNEHH